MIETGLAFHKHSLRDKYGMQITHGLIIIFILSLCEDEKVTRYQSWVKCFYDQ